MKGRKKTYRILAQRKSASNDILLLPHLFIYSPSTTDINSHFNNFIPIFIGIYWHLLTNSKNRQRISTFYRILIFLIMWFRKGTMSNWEGKWTFHGSDSDDIMQNTVGLILLGCLCKFDHYGIRNQNCRCSKKIFQLKNSTLVLLRMKWTMNFTLFFSIKYGESKFKFFYQNNRIVSKNIHLTFFISQTTQSKRVTNFSLFPR